ncbi:MAG: hypothetical protein KGD73_03985 [Candidatus Lokiarchaeota archaeon]|nr:hypothetical protein [Candidatus Lokiarchaeota archaeon]
MNYFESIGSFNSGKTSHKALTSKKSRGIITLTDQGLSFQSEKDKIINQIKIIDINNFYFKRRHNLHVIELEDIHGNSYSTHAMIKKNDTILASKYETENLFRHLTRIVLKKDKTIFFEVKSGFWNGLPNILNWKSNMESGIIILTEDYLSFKAYEKGEIRALYVLNINKIIPFLQKSTKMVQIEMSNKDLYTCIPLREKFGRQVPDKNKIDKFIELLNQVKMYKESEQLKLKDLEKERLDQIKSMIAVSTRLKLKMMRIALNLDEKIFTKKIFEWAKKFNFIIDGDYLIVNPEYISDFLQDLGEDQSLKVQCAFCQKFIEPNVRICPYCGVTL